MVSPWHVARQAVGRSTADISGMEGVEHADLRNVRVDGCFYLSPELAAAPQP